MSQRNRHSPAVIFDIKLYQRETNALFPELLERIDIPQDASRPGVSPEASAE